VLAVLLGLALPACDGGRERANVLVARGGPEVVLMDFSEAFPLDPPPEGWRHHRFWTRRPMEMGFAVKDGVPALRAETRGTASMLFRHVDVDLAAYPVLAWRWYVERPVESPLDERTREGDDHPARLFLAFLAGGGRERAMEIIWGNRLRAGDYKVIGDFPHYVADGGDGNVGRWRDEEVDLAAIYRHLWPDDGAPVRLVDIAVFCDTDETGGRSVSYVADVRVKRATAASAP
jgi:hypothetical protein